ncbi:rhomboid family intramembrane serine protease [Amycolatopsis umgeniensis]|uniref:Membrane associated rhomboid family serine protease n=1 Tax=Amycolatopsis umgeniensis TaxID=336628 RepID=A0A841B7S9_9PSEU|nr:rhomboid family intramembrane serine protease [Amycolatopsis umgeniensis]MBB5854632.1 membrane associated rhomboid family serine protease [Amycolatopsis umgeniensis]
MTTASNLPRSGQQDAEAMIAEAKKAFWVMVGLLVVIWAVQIFNALDGYAVFETGARARDISTLPAILFAPFIHTGWEHIEGNSGPLFIFGFLAAYRGVKKFFGVTLLIAMASGLGAWFLSPSGLIGFGASGLVMGFFGYVLVRGIFDRHKIDIVIGLVMALCFAYQFASLFPQNELVSWQAHLFGFLGGLVGGWVFRDRRPKPEVTAPAFPTVPLTPPDTLK